MGTGVRKENGEHKNVASKVKFEVYGEEILKKIVKQSGTCGRVYLPPIWIGKHVKIVLID